MQAADTLGSAQRILVSPLAKRLARIPLGRMGTVAEMVSLVLYLASDESAYMSGSEILIDGGAMAQ